MKLSVRPIWRFLVAPFRHAHAPVDARPCCQEAAFRLFGRCDGGCSTDSQIYHLVEDWSDVSRQSRRTDLRTYYGRR
jgi:hypothetical protein